MTTAVKSKKENLKEDNSSFKTAISSLKKSISDYKTERKSDWKSFKTKFNDDLEKVEKSLKKMTTLHLK